MKDNDLNAQADMFAMGFLMPEKEFKKICKKHANNVWLVSAHFQVPVDKVRLRMEYFGIKGKQ